MLMPDVVHDEASGQGQRQFRKGWHPRVRRRRDQGRDLRGRRRPRLLGGARRITGRRVVEQTLPGAAVEHRLDVLPGVDYLVRGIPRQFHVPSPRVEIGCVRLDVLVRRPDPVRVEDELVRREEEAAVRAFDALGAGAVVPGRKERAPASPGALVVNGERKVLGQS